ncbi:unnamed protein product [Brugia timori]|uniref:Bm8646 n=2 Tax=Brugia TaxID=6278 RepID=A0A0H5S1G2_BRUMA|nr:Bm8646 [Brugia malayi]VDO17402.1 unnamed protein product [Brugia timori]
MLNWSVGRMSFGLMPLLKLSSNDEGFQFITVTKKQFKLIHQWHTYCYSSFSHFISPQRN